MQLKILASDKLDNVMTVYTRLNLLIDVVVDMVSLVCCEYSIIFVFCLCMNWRPVTQDTGTNVMSLANDNILWAELG